MEENNSGRKLVGILVVVVLIAIILAIWFSVRGPKTDNTAPEAASFSAAQELNRDAELEVPDQFPGNVVYVSRADLSGGGFVVIRKDNRKDMEIGTVIGATFFDKDTRIGNVDLSESLMDGQFYIAQGWTDDGDAIFSETKDKLIEKRADGTPLVVGFKATRDLPERKD
jgi:hypothetical protein